MIDNYLLPNNSRMLFSERNPESWACVINDVGGYKDITADKESLAHLLRLGLAETSTRSQSTILNENEELSRLIPILCACFSSEELVQLVGKKAAAKIQQIHRLEMLQNLFLERELQEVLHAFNQANIPLILFKGPALAYTIYPKPYLRTYHDIDALISPSDISRAQTLLTDMGYTFYDEYRVDAVDEQRTGYNYTLQRPGSPLAVIIELHTAPHNSEIGALFERGTLWQRAQPITVLGEQTLTLNPADHLLYLCWHYRFHGFSRLLWLYDVVMMVRTYGKELDWTTLIRMAHRQQLGATLYYCLLWSRNLFGVPVPHEVMVQLCPPLISRLIVEHFAMPNAAKALASVHAHDRRLVARRVMVDRQRDLFKAFLRLLFPSPLALSKRYMDKSRLPLQLFFLFYLIHPWLTLAKGCRYFLTRRKKR